MENLALEPGQIISHFKIEKLLGQGGMASVYLAKDINLSRSVALKFMNRESVAMNGNPDYIKNLEHRFKREAQSAAQINHPNIAQLYEASFDNNNWYIAMEYIEGKSIREYLDDGKIYSVKEILRILKQVARGLKYAWDNYQIVHRDITPQNLMMSGSTVIKIVDLGLAKPVMNGGIDTEVLNLTTAGAPVGTPYYMAPEQAAGTSDIDHRADIFALGATIYEVSTGQKPFSGKTAPMIYMAQLEKKYKPINHISKNFPEKLEHLIYAMLEPNREERIDSFFTILKTVNSIGSTGPTLNIEIDKITAPKNNEIPEIENNTFEIDDDDDQEKEEQTSNENITENPINDLLELDIDLGDKQENGDNNLEESPDSKVENLINEIKEKCNLPALQVNVMDLTNVCRKSNSRASDLVAIIMRDSALSSNLLATINSVLYRPRIPIQTISSAVVLLGFEKVQSLALRLSIFDKQKKNSKNGILYRLLLHSYFTGSFALSLVRTTDYRNPEEAFVAGLLSQLPHQVLANSFPQKYAQMENLVRQGKSYKMACIDAFEVDYEEICQTIVNSWNFPENITRTILDIGGYKNPILPYVKEAINLADLIFGYEKDKLQKIKSIQKRLQKLLRNPKFSIYEFIKLSARRDENIAKFFNLNENDINQIVKVLKKGELDPSQFEFEKKEGQTEEQVNSARRKQALSRYLQEIDHCANDSSEGNGNPENNLNHALTCAQEAVFNLLNPSHFFTAFINYADRSLVGKHYTGENNTLDPSEFLINLSEKESPIIKAIKNRKTIMCHAYEEDLLLPADLLTKLKLDSIMVTPVIFFNRVFGLFFLGNSDDKEFKKAEKKNLDQIVAHLASTFAKK